MNLTINEKASKSLGSENSYAVYTDIFDASLLNPLLRSEARKDWEITGKEFVGCDIWHCHEATFLLNSGAPIAGTLKFKYSSDSDFIVESKSMKLYLNSFDMCRMGDTIKQAVFNYKSQIKKDLEQYLNTEVEVGFFLVEDTSKSFFDKFNRLEDLFDLENTKITDYRGESLHFKLGERFPGTSYRNDVYTNVLRSRCRHTKQKDTGTAFLSLYSEERNIDAESLFKQVVSLRDVNEFHEFCAEQLFIQVTKDKNIKKCLVALLYARRGSLDINPLRASSLELLPEDYINVNKYSFKTQGQ